MLTSLGSIFPEVIMPTVEFARPVQVVPSRPRCRSCGSRYLHRSYCNIFAKPMPQELNPDDENSLSRDQDLLEVLSRTLVSDAVAEECCKELAAAQKRSWIF